MHHAPALCGLRVKQGFERGGGHLQHGGVADRAYPGLVRAAREYRNAAYRLAAADLAAHFHFSAHIVLGSEAAAEHQVQILGWRFLIVEQCARIQLQDRRIAQHRAQLGLAEGLEQRRALHESQQVDTGVAHRCATQLTLARRRIFDSSPGARRFSATA